MRTMPRITIITYCLAVAMAASSAQASQPALRLSQLGQSEVDQQVRIAVGHPNEFWRFHGLRQHLSGRDGEAARHFERAAGYADKLSQHYLSLLYWQGQGVPQDRVLAYIWSDLAAERGHRNLLRIRERMWLELTDAQRAEVLQRGEAMHAKFADAYAKPRAEREIFRKSRQMTGSKAGFDGQMLGMTFGGPIHGSFGNATPAMQAASEAVNGGASGADMYADNRVDPGGYWQAQDAEVGRLARARVKVGAIEQDAKPD